MRILKLFLLLMALPATDTFTGAAGVLPNPPWTQQAASATNVNLNGSGGFTASVLDGSDTFAFENQNVYPNDHYSEIALGPLVSSGQWYRVTTRAKDTGGAAFDAYDFFTDGSSGAGHTQLQKWVNGTPTAVANVTATFVNGDKFRAQSVGNQHSLLKNGVVVGGPYTDNSLATGSAGIGCAVNAGGTLAGDLFEGGAVAVAYGLAPLLDKPLTLLRCRPLGPGNPLREVKYYDVPVATAVGITIVTDVGDLLLDGFSPAIGLPKTLIPGFGDLQLTGFAAQFPTTLVPGSGALSLTGFGPSVGLPKTIVPGFGQLTLAGFSATFPRTLVPATGALDLNGFAPTFARTIKPGFGDLQLSGFAASFTFVTGGYTAQPGSGVLSLTGFGPTIGLPKTVQPGLGALTLSGLPPAIGLPITARPGSGLLTLSGFGPAFSFTPAGLFVTPGTGQLTLTGYAPWIGTFTFRIEGGPVMMASLSGGGVLVASIVGGPTFTGTITGGLV